MLIRSDPFTGSGNNIIYLTKLSAAFAKCFAGERLTDVIVKCKDGFFSAHKMVLANGSIWLKDYFASVGDVEEIFLSCPDFSLHAMSKVMEILYTGVTYLEDPTDISEMRDIVKTLGFKPSMTQNLPEIETPDSFLTSGENLSNNEILQIYADKDFEDGGEADDEEFEDFGEVEEVVDDDDDEEEEEESSSDETNVTVVEVPAAFDAPKSRSQEISKKVSFERSKNTPEVLVVMETPKSLWPKTPKTPESTKDDDQIDEDLDPDQELEKQVLANDVHQLHADESPTIATPEQEESAAVLAAEGDGKEIKPRSKLVGKRCQHCGEIFRGTKFEIHAGECKFIPPDIDAPRPKRLKAGLARPLSLTTMGTTNDKQEYKFGCHLCSRLFRSYNPLFRHMAYYHFKELRGSTAMEEVEVGNNQCKVCDKIFSELPTLFVHLAMSHGALKSVIPPKSNFQIGSPAVVESLPKLPVSEPVDVPPLMTSSASSSLECYICCKAFKQSYVLLQHYAWVHFRSNIEEKVAELCPPDCNGNTLAGFNRVTHMAVSHDALKSLIPGDQYVVLNAKRKRNEGKMVVAKKLVVVAKKVGNDKTRRLLERTTIEIPDKNGIITIYDQPCDLERCMFCADIFFDAGKAKQHLTICPKRPAAKKAKSCCRSSTNNNNTSGKFCCHLCPKTRATEQMMIWHLGLEHFKEKIRRRHALTEKNLKCPVCQKEVKLHHQLILHLAQTHQGLKGLIPEALFKNLFQEKIGLKDPPVVQKKATPNPKGSLKKDPPVVQKKATPNPKGPLKKNPPVFKKNETPKVLPENPLQCCKCRRIFTVKGPMTLHVRTCKGV